MESTTYRDRKGYRRFSNSNKLLHRYRAEKKLGRKLEKVQVVQFKNGDKLGNSYTNLCFFSNQEELYRIHKIDSRRHGQKISYKGLKKPEGYG
jgi:hypothetical protein